jgi:hypothetical protein
MLEIDGWELPVYLTRNFLYMDIDCWAQKSIDAYLENRIDLQVYHPLPRASSIGASRYLEHIPLWTRFKTEEEARNRETHLVVMATSASPILEAMVEISVVFGYSVYLCGIVMVGAGAYMPSRRTIFRGLAIPSQRMNTCRQRKGERRREELKSLCGDGKHFLCCSLSGPD